jgi:membrane protease YdiL (CAAX protease family)
MTDNPRFRHRGTLAVSLVIASLYPALMAWVYFVQMAGNPTVRPAYALGKAVQFALPILCVRFCLGEPIRWRARPGVAGLGAGLLFGVLAAAGACLLYWGWLRGGPAFDGVPEALRAKLADFGAATPRRYLALATFLTLAHSGLEEYYWRWFVFGRMRGFLPPAAAIALSGLLFMLHHVIILTCYFPPGQWPFVAFCSLAVAIGGAAWALIYHRTGNLAAAWASHALVDAALMLIGWDIAFSG